MSLKLSDQHASNFSKKFPLLNLIKIGLSSLQLFHGQARTGRGEYFNRPLAGMRRHKRVLQNVIDEQNSGNDDEVTYITNWTAENDYRGLPTIYLWHPLFNLRLSVRFCRGMIFSSTIWKHVLSRVFSFRHTLKSPLPGSIILQENMPDQNYFSYHPEWR